MEENKKFEVIISVVNRGFSDAVVEGARKAGASGGTILYGRGTSNKDNDSFMGVSIQPEKEVIFTLTDSNKKQAIMQGICENANIEKEGIGICFSLPVNQVRGISAYNKKPNDEKPKKS